MVLTSRMRTGDRWLELPLACVHAWLMFLGDWKLNKEYMYLQQSCNNTWVCHECWATKGPGPDNFANVRPGAFENRRARTHEEYLDHFDDSGFPRPAL